MSDRPTVGYEILALTIVVRIHFRQQGHCIISRCSSVGRAPGLGPGGRSFEYCHLDQILRLERYIGEMVSYHSVTVKSADRNRYIPQN